MKFNKIAIITLAAAMMSSCGVYKNYERPNEITVNGIYGNAESGDSLGFGDLQSLSFCLCHG